MPTGNNKELVIVVHGLWLSSLWMLPLSNRLKSSGHNIYNFEFGTWLETPDQAIQRLVAILESNEAMKIHLVGHSLGGIIILHALKKLSQESKLGSLVFLGVPLRANHLAKRIKGSILSWIFLGRYAALLKQDHVNYSNYKNKYLIYGTRSFRASIVRDKNHSGSDGMVLVDELELEQYSQSNRFSFNTNHLTMIFSKPIVQLVDVLIKKTI